MPAFMLGAPACLTGLIANMALPGGAKGPCLQKCLENMVILCFERRFSKQNRVIRLKSNILPPQNFRAGYATDPHRKSVQESVLWTPKHLRINTRTELQLLECYFTEPETRGRSHFFGTGEGIKNVAPIS